MRISFLPENAAAAPSAARTWSWSRRNVLAGTPQDALHHLERMQRHVARGARHAAVLKRICQIDQTDAARVFRMADRVERMTVRYDRPRRIYILRAAFRVCPAVFARRAHQRIAAEQVRACDRVLFVDEHRTLGAVKLHARKLAVPDVKAARQRHLRTRAELKNSVDMRVHIDRASTVPFAGPDGTERVCAARVAIAQTRRTGPSRLSSAVT